MSKHRIRFLPDGREVEVDEGATLLDAATKAGVYVGGVCGGEGVCGKCRVIVKEGEVAGESTEFLTREEIRRGYVLACRVRPGSNLVVEVPPESRLAGKVDAEKGGDRFRDFTYRGEEGAPAELRPLVEKLFLKIPEPTLDDQMPDRERLLSAAAKLRPGPMRMGLKATLELPRILRKLEARGTSWKWTWDGEVTAAIGARADGNELLFVERGDTAERIFGLAVDVGTTTVAAHLVDLASGRTVEAAAKYNSQVKYGADVITRINYARRERGGGELHGAVIGDIEVLIEELSRRSGVARGDICCVAASGNTTMTHLLLGLESDLIRLSPFVPAAASPPPCRAAEVGIKINPRGLLYALPAVGSYVGGDITAGVLASGMHLAEELSLLLDIGTNGEVVVGSRDFLVACSASAGPAFEGQSVKCGMRATSGAIDHVKISGEDLAVSASTIDGSPPVGLCGTGLIELLAEMFLAGLVDRNGRFQVDRAPGRFRTSEEDGRPEFLFVAARESGGARDVVITQADVEDLIRTKGAVYAAVDLVVTKLGLAFDDVKKIHIAGAFGNKLDVRSCITVGLLPDVPPDRIEFIGNSSLAGAKMAMCDRGFFEESKRLRDRITYQELMVDPAYMDRFTSACFLPHTDLSRFPSVETKLRTSATETRRHGEGRG